MQTRNISLPEALELTKREETHFYDHKAVEVGAAKIAKVAVAFSNADGGEFIIGIRDAGDEPDPEKRWAGVEEIERLNDKLQVLFSITPSLSLRYEVLICDELPGQVLRVNIDKGAEVAKSTDGNVYVRYGAQSLKLSDPQKITELSFAKGATTFEDSVLKDVPSELIVDSDELASFLRDYSPRTDELDFCLSQNLVDYRTWEPRVCSAVLFHADPSAVVPRKCGVKITRYVTKEDEPERAHLAEQVSLSGPAYRLIHEAVTAVTQIMSSIKVWTSKGLASLSYPPEAIWETIVNAIIHRDYAISDDVQILIFDDRIEILSPGKLPGYVNVSNILEARYSRNPKIVRTLNRYVDPPNKDLGEGLNTTFQKMKEWGLRAPTVSEEGNYVKVALPHTPLATPTEAIMKFLQTSDTVTNRQAREITGIKSENLVKVEFYKLRDAEMIERVPNLSGPKSAWRLTQKGKSYDVGSA